MRSTEYVDINLSSHNSLFQVGRFLKTELSGSRSVACCRWMLFALPFSGPSRQFWCCGLLSLSGDCFLHSTAPRSPILSFICFSPYRATWGSSSVQSLVLEFLWLLSHDPPFLSSFLCELICIWDFACCVHICKPVCLSAFPCLQHSGGWGSGLWSQGKPG